jgi:ABC-2 type transport system permease protein
MSAPPPPPVSPAERPPAPPITEAAGQIMLRQVVAAIRGRRFLAAAALVGLPPLLIVLMRVAAEIPNPDPVPLTRIVVQLIVTLLVPLTALSLGSGLLHQEAEEGTLTFLFTTPIHRSAVVLGKWAAALAVGWGLMLVSLAATLLLSPVDLGPLGAFVRASVMAVLLGIAAYLGLFTLLGTLFRHGYIGGLLYAFGFETILWLVPGAAKRLSIGFFLRSLLEPTIQDKAPFEGSFTGLAADSASICIAVLLSVALLTVAATLLIVPGKEFRARNVQG